MKIVSTISRLGLGIELPKDLKKRTECYLVIGQITGYENIETNLGVSTMFKGYFKAYNYIDKASYVGGQAFFPKAFASVVQGKLNKISQNETLNLCVKIVAIPTKKTVAYEYEVEMGKAILDEAYSLMDAEEDFFEVESNAQILELPKTSEEAF
jgi:hypothetical protein